MAARVFMLLSAGVVLMLGIIHLALAQPRVVFESWFLLATGMATLIALVVLCRMYFFTAPLLGVGIAWIFYVISVALAIGPAGRSV